MSKGNFAFVVLVAIWAFLSGHFLHPMRIEKEMITYAKLHAKVEFIRLFDQGKASVDDVILALHLDEAELCNNCFGLLEEPRQKYGIRSAPVISSFRQEGVSYIIYYGTQYYSSEGFMHFDFKPAYYIETADRGLRRIDSDAVQTARSNKWELVSLVDSPGYNALVEKVRLNLLVSW